MKKKVLTTSLFITTLIPGLLTPITSRAADDFEKIYLLASDVMDITNKNNEKPNFVLTTTEADKMVATSVVDDSLKAYLNSVSFQKDCEEKSDAKLKLQSKIDGKKFKIEGLVLVNGLKYEQNALGRFMNNDYMTFLSKEYNNGNMNVWDIYSINNLQKKYLEANPSAKLDSMSLSEKENVLAQFAEAHLKTKLPPGLLMKEMAFQEMLIKSDDWQKTLSEAKDKLSSDQKLQLVSKVLGYFGNNYNYDRRDGGSKEIGKFVSQVELLKSAQTGTPGGICRDIALAGTQFLEALGFEKSYVVSYRTVDGSHATVITTDPVTKKIIKFNYDETTQTKAGAGTVALTQDTSMPDYGIKYRIYDSKGKPVTQVSSELGKMLRDTSGATGERDFDAKNYSLAKVGFQTGVVSGNLFTGKTSTGLNLYGVSVYQSMENEYLKTSIGASVSKLSGERSNIQMDQTNLYIRVAGEVTSPKINIGPVAASVFGGVETETSISNNKQSSVGSNRESEGKKQLDGITEFYLGAKGKLESSDQQSSLYGKAYATIYRDLDHNAAAGKVTNVVNSLVVEAGATHQMSEDLKAKMDVAAIVKTYGTSIAAKVLLEDEKRNMRYTASVATPITKNQPSYLPGSQTSMSAGVGYGTENLILIFEVEKNLSNKSTSVSAKVKGSFK
jgi:hypothetical protein